MDSEANSNSAFQYFHPLEQLNFWYLFYVTCKMGIIFICQRRGDEVRWGQVEVLKGVAITLLAFIFIYLFLNPLSSTQMLFRKRFLYNLFH